MKKFVFVSQVLLIGILSAGCEDKLSKEWYIKNHKEMISKYTECLLDQSWHDVSCQNAKNAMNHEMDKPDVKKGFIDARQKVVDKINKEGE